MATASIPMSSEQTFQAYSPDQDPTGLRTALLELFEESFQRSAIERKMPAPRFNAETRAAAIDEVQVRTLSPGYYTRAAYLFDLGNAIETRVQYGAGQLTRDDVRGLQLLAASRSEFLREHPSCPQCGERQESRFQSQCHDCGCKFTRGGS